MNKNVKRGFLIFLGFLLLCLVLYRPAAKNLILLELSHGLMSNLPRGFTNGNGEVKDFMPDGWQISNWGYSNQQQGLMVEPENGNVFFMLKTNEGGAASLSQTVSVQDLAAAQVKIRYQGGPAVIIVGQIQAGQDQPNPALQLRLNLPETATWSDARFDVSLDAKTERVTLTFASYAKEKPLLLDDAFFAINEQENMLTNSRFEEDGGVTEFLPSPLLDHQKNVFAWANDILKDDPVALLQVQAQQYYLAGDLTTLRQGVLALGQSDQADKNLGWLLGEGIRQYQHKQYLAAYETFQLVLVADPNQPTALFYLASMYNDLGAYDLAFSIFEKLPLSLNVAFPAGMIALNQKGDVEKARYYFEFIRTTFPMHYVSISNRLYDRLEYARGLVQAGQCGLAKEQFKIVAAVTSANTDLHRQALQIDQGLGCP